MVHRCPIDKMDWAAEASSLPPPWPREAGYHEFIARLRALDTLTKLPKDAGTILDEARREDAREFEGGKSAQVAVRNYAEKMRSLATRILRGETLAYADAVRQFEPFTDLTECGWNVTCTFHSSTICECLLETDDEGKNIPTEAKALTAGGKVTVRPMPQTRFNEMLQGFVCSSVLRAGRELLALLPLETVLVNVTVRSIDPATGRLGPRPILSVALHGSTLGQLDFNQLDSAAAVQNLGPRCDFKASRKVEAFARITPLTPGELVAVNPGRLTLPDLLAAAGRLREELQKMTAGLPRPAPATAAPEPLSP